MGALYAAADVVNDVDLLYEDDHMLAVNKPAGIVIHPSYKNLAGTLLDALRAYAYDWPADQRPSIVGRLDKLTSGIVIVARTALVHAMLQRVMAARETEKDYLAVVYGWVDAASGEIELRLRHDPNDRRMIIASSDCGVTSLTKFERLATVDAPHSGLSLLRCRLVTGRRHQIRVHLASRGWPIVGDPVYGEARWSAVRDPALAETLRTFPRQALHAWRVAFTHPITRERLTIKAPLPNDLEELLTVTGLPTLG
jgi:23S rRNA pseudouridine1911/1915/1917 synthase